MDIVEVIVLKFSWLKKAKDVYAYYRLNIIAALPFDYCRIIDK